MIADDDQQGHDLGSLEARQSLSQIGVPWLRFPVWSSRWSWLGAVFLLRATARPFDMWRT